MTTVLTAVVLAVGGTVAVQTATAKPAQAGFIWCHHSSNVHSHLLATYATYYRGYRTYNGRHQHLVYWVVAYHAASPGSGTHDSGWSWVDC